MVKTKQKRIQPYKSFSAEACRLRMTCYLLFKARRFEARAAAAEASMMNVNITVGTLEEQQQQPSEKDLKEIVIVA